MLKDKKNYFELLLTYLQNENLSINLLFITRDKLDRTYNVYTGEISADIGDSLRKVCLGISKKSYKKPETKIFKPYNASRVYQNREYLEGSELEKIRPLLNMISDNRLELRKIDKDFLDNLWYYVIVFDNGDKKMLFYKKYSKSMILKKGFGLAIIFKSGNFDKLKKDIFMLENKADCILFEDKLIIRSKGNFEKIFDFFEEVKQNAEHAITLIENNPTFKIDNFDVKKEKWMKNGNIIRKLNNIYTTKVLEKIKINDIQVLVNEKILKTITIKKDSEGKFMLCSEDPWELLNVLDDAYVKSRLTGINYQTSDKEEIKG